MSSLQLAVRFTELQIKTLDLLAARHQLTRSAVLKKLVDEAEQESIRQAYESAYQRGGSVADDFGDLEALHRESEAERVATRSADPGQATSW
jgi:hypothetical protein